MGDGQRKGLGGESGLVLSLMRILINPAEAAPRPPRFIRPEKPDCQEGEGRRGWGGDQERERREKFLLLKQRNVREEAGKGKKKCRERQRGGDRWEDGQRR